MLDAVALLSPYPGLRPFASEEADIFFGRETHTDRLVEILKREHFLAVVGPSGSGKSSLVRAGLLPAIEMGNLGSGTNWRIAVLRPGSDPIGSLATALLGPRVFGATLGSPTAAGIATDHTAIVEAELRRGPLGLLHVAEDARAGRDGSTAPVNLLVVVDQFEEIFTYAEAGDEHADESDLFVSLLLEARARVDANVYVVLTMRTDFLGNCIRFPALPEAINRAQYLTPRLTRAEMETAIEGPAEVYGGSVEPSLVAELINATQQNSDQLPLLQHALSRMWSLAAARDPTSPRIGWEDAGQVGGLSGALDQHAETILEQVLRTAGPRGAVLVEALFMAITERRTGSGGGQDVRRPMLLSRLAESCNLGKDWQALVPIVTAYAAPGVCFLQHGQELNESSVIDLSHEALMRQWKRLSRWVDAETRRRNDYLRWLERATEHEQGGGLLEGAALARASEWLKSDTRVPEVAWRPTAAWATRYSGGAPSAFERTVAFIEKSAHAAQKLEDDKRQALERERQAAIERAQLAEKETRRARRQLMLMGVFAVIVVALGVTAGYFAVRARNAAAGQRIAADLASAAEARAQLAQAQAEEFARRLDEQLAGGQGAAPGGRSPAASAPVPVTPVPAPASAPVQAAGAGAPSAGGRASAGSGRTTAGRGAMPMTDARPGKQAAVTPPRTQTMPPPTALPPPPPPAGRPAPSAKPEQPPSRSASAGPSIAAPAGAAPVTAPPATASASVALLTMEELAAIMPSSMPAARAAFLKPLNDAMAEFGIDTPLRRAHFLGQLAFEGGDLRYLQEQWGPTPAQQRYEPPNTLARSLGNTEPGDGKRYLGRGMIQIVGRRNYRQFGEWLNVNLVDNPELAATPVIAARVAAVYWNKRGLNAFADADNVADVTRRINGGLLGLETRTRAVARAKSVLMPAAK